MNYCIYCRGVLNENDPPDDMTKSKEHIVQLALGGSEEFTTCDTSKKYNNDFGRDIDAPFLNFLPLAIKRHQLRLKGHSGTFPPIKLRARSLDNGEALTVAIDVDGNISYDFPPTVMADRKLTHTEHLVAGSPERVREILAGMLAKARQRGNTIYSSTGERMSEIADFKRHFEVEETETVRASVLMDGDVWARGIFKILLGLGHVVLGPEWTFSAVGGDRMRSVLVLDREHWPHDSLQGFSSGRLPPDIARTLGITEAVRSAECHTIAVLPGFETVKGVVSLFGGKDVPEAMVTLGSERGRLAPVNETMNPSLRVGVRIDPRSRRCTWLTVSDLVANNS
jgi:hypothetical protein